MSRAAWPLTRSDLDSSPIWGYWRLWGVTVPMAPPNHHSGLNEKLLSLLHFLISPITVQQWLFIIQSTSPCCKARKNVSKFRPFQSCSLILQMKRLSADKESYYLLKTPQQATVRARPGATSPNIRHTTEKPELWGSFSSYQRARFYVWLSSRTINNWQIRRLSIHEALF